MKKVKACMSLLLIAIMAFSTNISVFAAELDHDSASGSATVVYKAGQTTYDKGTDDPRDDIVGGTYLVTIPDVIEASDNNNEISTKDVIISDALLPVDTKLTVHISFDSALKLADNPSVQIPYIMWANSQEINSGETILTLDAGDPDAVISASVGVSLAQAPAYSGVYSNTVVFSVSVLNTNLVKPEKSEYGHWDLNGVLIDSQLKHTDFIPVRQGGIYQISVTAPTPQIALFDENYQVVQTIWKKPTDTDVLDKYITITDPKIKYMSVNFNPIDQEYIYVSEVEEDKSVNRSAAIGFLGDSIMGGYLRKDGKLYKTYFNFGRIIASKMNAKVHVYGKDGILIAGTDSESITNNAMSISDDLDMIFIMGGMNDFSSGKEPFGTIDDQTTDTFYGALHVLMQTLTEKYAGKQIVYLTPLESAYSMTGAANQTTGKTLGDYVSAIKDVCAMYDNVTVLDMYSVSEQKFNPTDSTLFSDTLHPTQSGHFKIADYIYKELMEQGLIV